MIHPRVVVIVLNYNGARWLPACLDSLNRTTYANFLTVVVDNASTDESKKLIHEKYPQIVLLENLSNVGFSAGNNVGIEYALAENADYVVLLNPDTKVEPQWLSCLIEVGERTQNLGILGSIQLNYEDCEWNEWTRSALNAEQQALLLDQSACPDWIEMEWVEGSCFAIKCEVLQKIGLFDPIFFSFYEEIDFCRRARYHGFHTGLVTNSRFHHYRGGIWMTESINTVRNYQCDKSQFIYSLTAPDKGRLRNLLNYAQTFFVKSKQSLITNQLSYLWDLLFMQFSIARISPQIWRKWLLDRNNKDSYGKA